MPLSATLCSLARGALLRVGSGRRSARGLIGPREGAIPGAPRPIPSDPQDFAPPSDEDLLDRYRDSRRPEDFVELVRRYSGELGRYLARYVGDAALAEDVLQDTFLQVHRRCGRYRDEWPARPWLYTVTFHRSVDARTEVYP